MQVKSTMAIGYFIIRLVAHRISRHLSGYYLKKEDTAAARLFGASSGLVVTKQNESQPPGTEELQATCITQVESEVKYIISILMRYRYVVMLIMMILVPVLMVATRTLVGSNSFLALLGWIGMITLVEFNDPGPHRRKSYLFLVVIPLVMFACFGMATLVTIPPDALQNSVSIASLIVLWLLSIVLIGTFGLHTAWIDRTRTHTLYARVAVIALGIATALFALVVGMILLPWFAVVLLAPLFLLLVTELMTFSPVIPPLYRFLVIISIVLLATISIGGWMWLGLMSNGVDRFTGEERSVAQEFLDRAYRWCDDNPSLLSFRYRVFNDSNGRFYVGGYTWWRFRIGEPADTRKCYDFERFISMSDLDSRQSGL